MSPPDQTHKTGQRFGLYRWHVADPVRFSSRLKVTALTAATWQMLGTGAESGRVRVGSADEGPEAEVEPRAPCGEEGEVIDG